MTSLISLPLESGWEFKQTEDTSPDAWLPVERVPSVVHIDLMKNNRIPDTSCDLNELKLSWIGETSWTYRCRFPSPETSATDRVALVLEGLDTFATVELNDAEILKSDNMFIPHRIDITSHLHRTALNVLQITFESALLRAREIRKAHPEHHYIAHLGEMDRMGVRKADYHWGWDWGPVYMTAGPWRPVYLEVYTDRIVDVSVDYTLDSDLKQCKGTIYTHIDGAKSKEVRFLIYDPKGDLIYDERRVAKASDIMKQDFFLEDLSLWYPHGYGEQPLYSLVSELIIDDVVAHSMTKKIGFRKAELVQESDKYGKSFYVRVNGVDIFAGGNCWIPADNFLPRITAEKYRERLTLMVEGNQVMTRIWGGGIYEENSFYDICDELGILVWQDFLFACGSYPTFPSFLASVELEARANVRRLRHHPSLVLFAGGNENYYIQETYKLTYNFEDDKDPQSWLKSSFPSRYIFEYLLPKVVTEEAPSIAYHPDSPWGDGKRILDVTVGDIHQWEVWHGIMRPYQTYGQIGGRFNSEFGMQSFPHMSTIKKFINNAREIHPQSFSINFHNKGAAHERRIASYVFENFKAVGADTKYWIYLTQLLQSEAMHYAYRSWRREWNRPAERRCGGALVWQFNDCWPAVSWAVVDYFLVKKPAFYAIKRALTPQAVAVMRSHQDWTKGHMTHSQPFEYDLWVANSWPSNISDAVVEVSFISIETGFPILPTERHPVNIQANATTNILEGFEVHIDEEEDKFVICANLLINEEVVSTDVDWPQPFKYLSFGGDRGLKVELASSRKGIDISTMKPVKGLIFDERPGLIFSDNGLDILPGETYHVDVDGLEDGEDIGWTYLGQNERK